MPIKKIAKPAKKKAAPKRKPNKIIEGAKEALAVARGKKKAIFYSKGKKGLDKNIDAAIIAAKDPQPSTATKRKPAKGLKPLTKSEQNYIKMAKTGVPYPVAMPEDAYNKIIDGTIASGPFTNIVGNEFPNNEKPFNPNFECAPDSVDFDAMNKMLADRIASDKAATPADKLEHIKTLARAMRDLEFEIKDRETALKEAKTRFNALSMQTVPDLFAEHSLTSMTLEAEGNMPECTVKTQPFYKAVLPKDENDEPKAEGLDWLEGSGNGDLIKRVFTIELPMDSVKIAERLRNGLLKAGVEYKEKRNVPWTTLTAFVKEQIEKKDGIPLPLEKLGAIVGRIAKVKEVKK